MGGLPALEYFAESDGALELVGSLSKGWRKGPKTYCYIGQCKLTYGGADVWIRLQVFPWPSDLALETPPSLQLEPDLSPGAKITVKGSYINGRIVLEELTFKQEGPKEYKCYESALCNSGTRSYRVQLFVRKDCDLGKPEPTDWV